MIGFAKTAISRHAERLRGVATEFHGADGAGHGAFIGAFLPGPAAMLPPTLSDAPDFNRAAFQGWMNAKIVAFFDTHPGEA